MNLTELSIKKPVFAWMLMAAFIVFGALSFRKIGISQNPDIDFPVATVSFNWEGAAPEVIEMEVIDTVESALLAVEGIKEMSSTARKGSGSVTLEFNLNKDINVAIQEIQTILSQTVRRLPKDMDPPVVSKVNPEDRPIMWLAVTAKDWKPRQLMEFVRDRVKDQFVTLDGVSEVLLGGYVDPNLRVYSSEKKLHSYELSILDVLNTIKAEHAEYPAGLYETPEKEYNLRVLGEAYDAQKFAQLPITKRGGLPNYVPIYLNQVARVEDDLADIRRISRVNGDPAVGLGIKKQRGANTVDVAKKVKAKMRALEKGLPPGVGIGLNFDTTTFIEESIHELLFTLGLAVVLTALVCWVFLGSLGATTNIILAIPTSIIGCFMAIKFLGFTLNTFTLLALTLSVGLVVDDNIMVLENIVRHMGILKDRVKASLIGTKEISFAAIAATVSIVAIFLPIGFMEGIIGKYFFQFAVTISITVFISLIDALTLTPMRCSLYAGDTESHGFGFFEKIMKWGEQSYARALKFALGHRVITIVLSIIFCLLTFPIALKLKKEFTPAQDQGTLMLRLQAPPGSSLAFTDAKAKEVEAILNALPERDRYFLSVGGFGGNESNTATIFVTLKSIKSRPKDAKLGRSLTQAEVATRLREEFKKIQKAKVFVQDMSFSSFGGGRGYPVEFDIKGPDWNVLIQTTEKILEKMKANGQMVDVDSSYKGMVSEVHITPLRDKALARGVSIRDLTEIVQATMSGIVAGKFTQGGRRYDIRLKIDPAEVLDINHLQKIHVRNNRGELIPLSEIARIEEKQSLQAITRENRQRAISVYANVAPKSSQGEAVESTRAMAKELLPEGYFLEETGSSKEMNDSFRGLLGVFFLGILVAYMILAGQFNSFIQPVIVLMAMPFSISGAFIALYLGGQSLNVLSMIGMILLMGLVKKNSIILVDYTNHLRGEGLSRDEALIQACPIRLRPILMTSFATVAGALPAALHLGPGAESSMPMSFAVIGGIIVSTFLTLIVIPCLYSLCIRDRPIPA